MEQTSTQSKFAVNTPVAIIIASVIIGGAVIWGNGRRTLAPTAGATAQQQAQTADVNKVKIANEPFIGSANAPVTMVYWYDYQCPFCQRHEQTAMPQIVKDYVDAGKLKIVFKDYQFLGPDSQTLGKFSHAVWELAPDKFYRWHKAVYDNQGTENTGWATQEKIVSITNGVLGADMTTKVMQLVKINGDEYQKEMDDDREEGTSLGINGTPGSIIGKQLISGAVSYADFKSAIDAALNAK